MPGSIKFFKQHKAQVAELPLTFALKGSSGFVEQTGGAITITRTAVTLVASPTDSSQQVFYFPGTGSSGLTISGGYASVLPVGSNFQIDFDYYPETTNAGYLFTSRSQGSYIDDRSHVLRLLTNDVLNFQLLGRVGTSTPNGAVVANHWYHVSARKQGNVRTLYVNSVLIGTFEDTVAGQVSNYMSFGRARNELNSTWTNLFKGYMDNIQIRAKMP